MSEVKFKAGPPPKVILDTPEKILGVPAGSFVKVIYHKENSNLNEYLLRTNDKERPFIGLEDGGFWGTALSNYRMELIPPGEITITF